MYVRCSLREIPSPLCSFNWVILSKKSLNTVNCDIFLLIASDNGQLDFLCIPLQCLEPCYTTTPRASCSRLVMAATVPCCLLPISLNFFLVQGSYKKFAAGWKVYVSFWIFGCIHTGFVPYIQGHFKTSSQIQGLFSTAWTLDILKVIHKDLVEVRICGYPEEREQWQNNSFVSRTNTLEECHRIWQK